MTGCGRVKSADFDLPRSATWYWAGVVLV